MKMGRSLIELIKGRGWGILNGSKSVDEEG